MSCALPMRAPIRTMPRGLGAYLAAGHHGEMDWMEIARTGAPIRKPCGRTPKA